MGKISRMFILIKGQLIETDVTFSFWIFSSLLQVLTLIKKKEPNLYSQRDKILQSKSQNYKEPKDPLATDNGFKIFRLLDTKSQKKTTKKLKGIKMS